MPAERSPASGRARGFTESDHYLYVYANYHANADEPGKAVEPRPVPYQDLPARGSRTRGRDASEVPARSRLPPLRSADRPAVMPAARVDGLAAGVLPIPCRTDERNRSAQAGRRYHQPGRRRPARRVRPRPASVSAAVSGRPGRRQRRIPAAFTDRVTGTASRQGTSTVRNPVPVPVRTPQGQQARPASPARGHGGKHHADEAASHSPAPRHPQPVTGPDAGMSACSGRSLRRHG